jgi:hypothetical protein
VKEFSKYPHLIIKVAGEHSHHRKPAPKGNQHSKHEKGALLIELLRFVPIELYFLAVCIGVDAVARSEDILTITEQWVSQYTYTKNGFKLRYQFNLPPMSNTLLSKLRFQKISHDGSPSRSSV